uniref:Uncharacterized protein n=1 Tax=Anguilla anguilla TaxID=7936 RepID=A0A0E9WSH4_ANGAN
MESQGQVTNGELGGGVLHWDQAYTVLRGVLYWDEGVQNWNRGCTVVGRMVYSTGIGGYTVLGWVVHCTGTGGVLYGARVYCTGIGGVQY